MTSNKQFLRFVLLPLVFGFSTAAAFGQDKSAYKKRDFCSGNNYSYNDKVSVSETREIKFAAQSEINVDARRNGGISVRGEDRPDVLVRACVQTMGESAADAAALAKTIRIETGAEIRAEGGDDENGWSVSYEITVPRNSNLNLTAQNGGIAVRSVEGNIEFQTKNGGVSVVDTAGNVKGKTTNGGVNVTLSGGSWRGGGLDVETTNGGVHLTMPENYAARVETGTVNGGFTSDIRGLSVEDDGERKNYGRTKKQISTDLNGGGATVRVVTKNGGVKIASLSGRE